MTKPRPFGHYFILEKIAQGGMAEIFKGLTYDFSGIKKFIVIKRILPHIAANKEFIDMLVAEAKIAVNLSHGNIAQVYDLGKVGSDYFIVMEYVDGKSLSQIQRKCQEKGVPIPVEFCAYFISELCSGLDYMHRKTDEFGNEMKIVHRDISPQNIIVSYSGNVKIVDFGVAKAAFKLGEGERGILKGKFAYMSPEQAEGVEIDSRSDLFSAGIVLWELLTTQRLFKKKLNSETVWAVKNMAAVPPSQFRSDVPHDLDQIVLKALEKNPDKRYISAQDMNLDLTKFLLKYHSDFKPSSVSQFLDNLFESDDEITRDIQFEKTMREEETFADYTQSLGGSKSPVELKSNKKILEDTQVVDPQQIDFRSIFEEISWEDDDEYEEVPHLLTPIRSPSVIKSNEEELSITNVLPFSSPKKAKSWIRPALFLAAFALLLTLLIYWLG
jgi:serine/threonine protein kinase